MYLVRRALAIRDHHVSALSADQTATARSYPWGCQSVCVILDKETICSSVDVSVCYCADKSIKASFTQAS